MKYFVLFCCLALSLAATPSRGADAPGLLQLKDGDRVAFIGNTFIEREQVGCYIETALTERFPTSNVTFRNLGYSADDVTGSARGLCAGWSTFEGADKAFDRLRKLVAEFKPTVLIINYGMTESFSGPEGLPTFTANYNKMLDELAKAAGTSPRVVLLTPNFHEDLGKPLPDPAEHNKNLKLYADAIAAIAKERKAQFVDLFGVGEWAEKNIPSWPPMTLNGIHFTPYGYWRISTIILSRLDAGLEPWQGRINAGNQTAEATGARVSGVKSTPEYLEFTIVDDHLPRPPVPPGSPRNAIDPNVKWLGRGYDGQIQVDGLVAATTYELKANGKTIVKGPGTDWAKGVRLVEDPAIQQTEELRKLIVAKNFDFFNYQRPDNDAYILAFRRGEQGKNAVEIPRFLPLVEEKEKQIAALRAPRPVTYTLQAVK